MSKKSATTQALLPAVRGAAPTPRDKFTTAALLIALLALVANALLWVYHIQQRRTVQNSLDALDHKQTQDRLRLEGIEHTTADLAHRQANVEHQQQTLSKQYQGMVHNDTLRLLDEAEQTLTVTAQQLQWTGNTHAAITVLSGLEEKLQATPQFTRLKAALAQNLQALKHFPPERIPMKSRQIDQLIADIDRIPLLTQDHTEKIQASSDLRPLSPVMQFFKECWQSIKDLFQIRRVDDPKALPQAQALVLRETIILRLLSARLALLRQEKTMYESDLTAARAMLQRHFDPAATQNLLSVLNRLIDEKDSLMLPSLDESLAAVLAARRAKEKQ